MPTPEKKNQPQLTLNRGRLLIMGDVHGQYEKMHRVLLECSYKAGEDRLILLGDYVDRGPESCEVVQEVMKLVRNGAIAIYGNHEDLMVRALTGGLSGKRKSLDVEQWYANGGEITLSSYKTESRLLQEHLAFFATLPYWYEQEGFLFVHAGIRPDISIDKQALQDLIWIREEYILGYKGRQPIVSGHTPTQYLKRYELFPDIEDASKPVIRNRKYFLDTGVAWGGPLTVMDLITEEYWQAV